MGSVVALATRLGLIKAKINEGNFDKIGKSFYDLKANTLEGQPFDFHTLQGKVVLVTNVACLCGFTNSNYQQLVELDKKYQGRLEILAFPCNDFGGQEPKGPKEIREFVEAYDVKFHMMEKIHVNGPKTHPVYLALKEATGTLDEDIKWNFETKFLVGKDGKSVDRFSKMFAANDMAPFIERMLGMAHM